MTFYDEKSMTTENWRCLNRLAMKKWTKKSTNQRKPPYHVLFTR